ncbi:MAG: 3-hexulose-6-phosphate synthase [Christensenellales bacterium]|jgi:3-hexulose-6-phosphate synthase
MKKLQVALDLFSTWAALAVLEEVAEYVDIIELGTPLMIAEGCHAVRTVKKQYPDKIVFADIKVMDGGRIVPKIAFDAGADMVSVLAAADDETVRGTIELAREYGKMALVDTCAVPDIVSRAKQIEAMQPDYICVHVGTDVQKNGIDPVEQLRKLDHIKTPKAIAGGISLANFEEAAASPAEVIISGGGICNHPDMRQAARQMRAVLERYA